MEAAGAADGSLTCTVSLFQPLRVLNAERQPPFPPAGHLAVKPMRSDRFVPIPRVPLRSFGSDPRGHRRILLLSRHDAPGQKERTDRWTEPRISTPTLTHSATGGRTSLPHRVSLRSRGRTHRRWPFTHVGCVRRSRTARLPGPSGGTALLPGPAPSPAPRSAPFSARSGRRFPSPPPALPPFRVAPARGAGRGSGRCTPHTRGYGGRFTPRGPR